MNKKKISKLIDDINLETYRNLELDYSDVDNIQFLDKTNNTSICFFYRSCNLEDGITVSIEFENGVILYEDETDIIEDNLSEIKEYILNQYAHINLIELDYFKIKSLYDSMLKIINNSKMECELNDLLLHIATDSPDSKNGIMS